MKKRSENEINHVTKIRYKIKTPYDGEVKMREWDNWGMRQKGYSIDSEGNFVKLE